MWYEDPIVGMVEIKYRKKKNNTTKIKEERATSVDNPFIGFHKALQTFQCLKLNEIARVMDQGHNTIGPTT